MRVVYGLVVFALVLLFPVMGLSQPTITMNGVDITGVTSQRFTNVTIEFDAQGNIKLDAPQYKVVDTSSTPVDPSATRQIQGTAKTLPQAAVSSENVLPSDARATYLVAAFNYPGLLGYSIDLSINGRFIRTIPQGNSTFVLDVTQYLIRGKNTIQYRLVMAADSGTSSKATVGIHFAKQVSASGNTVELTGQYAPILIEGIKGEKTYHVEVVVE